MKLLFLLGLCAVVASAPQFDALQANDVNNVDQLEAEVGNRNILLNLLIRQMFTYIRFVINNGSSLLDIPPLDPLEIDEYQLEIPAGLINLNLHLEKILMTGVGGFVVNRSNLRLSDLTFEIDISVPRVVIQAEQYDFAGDLFSAIPLYGKGAAQFIVENFRFRALIYLKQSDDGKSVLIDRIESPSFEIPTFTSNLDGAIGGGDIDKIVNSVIEEVSIDYINRFQGAIAQIASSVIIEVGNPILDQLDTWRYLAPFL